VTPDDLFTAVFRSASDAMLIADDARRYVDANPAACALLGLPREQLVGTRIDDYGDGDPAEVGEAWTRFLEAGEQDGTMTLRAHDGTPRVVEFRARANVIPGRHLSILRDVTQRELLRTAVDDALERASEAMERLHLATDSADVGIWDFKPRSQELVWDARTKALFGFAPEAEPTYDDFLRHVAPEERARVHAEIQASLSPESSRELRSEYRVHAADGHTRWIAARGRAFFDGDQAHRLIGTVIDISERKRADEERQSLLASERQARAEADAERRRLHALFMHAPVALALFSGPEHLYEVANPRYCEIVGRCDLIGKPVRVAFPEFDERTPVVAALDEARKSGRQFVAHELEVKLQRGRGQVEPAWFSFVVQPIAGADAVMVVAADVTEQLVARRRLDDLRAQAEEANRAKDAFLAMLGHELRNPLAPMRTALEIMRLRDVGGLLDNERTMLERQVRHMVRLVDDLLDVSRITRGRVDLRKEPHELTSLVAKAIEIASPLFEQRSHHLVLDLDLDGVFVDGDGVRLAQVFANLLTNAAKYTEPGGRIEVCARASDRVVEVSVRDDGIGIAPEVLPHVFDLFVQAPQALDRAQGGLGVGLHLVKRLVELHDGSVGVESAPGAGSRFKVTLPRVTAPIVIARPPEPLASMVRELHDADSRGRRVLIVDDNEDAAELLALLLRDQGYETMVAYDGPAALEAVHGFLPEVVILDIGLPVMDGYEVARQMRAMPESAHARIVALTGYGQASDFERSRAAGADAHLVKPVDVQELRAVIDAHGQADRDDRETLA
jgi:PAS domain S-box-containing protein